MKMQWKKKKHPSERDVSPTCLDFEETRREGKVLAGARPWRIGDPSNSFFLKYQGEDSPFQDTDEIDLLKHKVMDENWRYDLEGSQSPGYGNKRYLEDELLNEGHKKQRSDVESQSGGTLYSSPTKKMIVSSPPRICDEDGYPSYSWEKYQFGTSEYYGDSESQFEDQVKESPLSGGPTMVEQRLVPCQTSGIRSGWMGNSVDIHEEYVPTDGGQEQLVIPFGVYHLCVGKRWIRNDYLPVYDFYCDMLLNFLLATTSGAGFAVTYELRTIVGHGHAGYGKTKKFLDIVFVSIGLLFLGSICVVMLSIISSYFRKFK
ncbi:hypothetical protein POM88_021899 [Heracleum sosnowskyi]|uniref:CASP-like protein n=1 Tax=Heracleum sosnowskyi TaxID=360622 RepID=A0AAD8IFR7_9APIA|nr:hypothetical protein POM88_021899 [Heracleum sosnowskyi]